MRLHLQARLIYNEVGRALKISKSAVGKYVSLARVAGVHWQVKFTTKCSLDASMLSLYSYFYDSTDNIRDYDQSIEFVRR